MEQDKKQPTTTQKDQNSQKNPKQKTQIKKNDENQKKTQQSYRIGNYLIEGTVGCGTFGKVKLGIHLPDKQKVAIKILDKSKMTEKDDHIRLEREFQILAKFNHPNLIMVTEIFESANHYYTVMELCEGGELFNYIVKKKYLSEEESAFFYYQLISGLEYIHSLGIVHRDLKPENLLLTKDHILKIIDFGLSNFFKEGQDELLYTPCGSPCYSSPEMVSGNNYDGVLIDVWSTGIILFAMLCGYLPFEDKNNEILFKKIVECKINYPDYLSDVSLDLLKKIIVPDPNKRITIPQIKKHPFYLMGKKIFDNEFSIEIINPKEMEKNNNNNNNNNSDNNTNNNINNNINNNNNVNNNSNNNNDDKKKKINTNNINNVNSKVRTTKIKTENKKITQETDKNLTNDDITKIGKLNAAASITTSTDAYNSTLEDNNNNQLSNSNNKDNKENLHKTNHKKNYQKINVESINKNNYVTARHSEYPKSINNKNLIKENNKNNYENSTNTIENCSYNHRKIYPKFKTIKNKEKQDASIKKDSFINIVNNENINDNKSNIIARNTFVSVNNNKLNDINKPHQNRNNIRFKERKTEIKNPQQKNRKSPFCYQINTTSNISHLNTNNLYNSVEKVKSNNLNPNIIKNYETRVLSEQKNRINSNSVNKSPYHEINYTNYNYKTNIKNTKKINENMKKNMINLNRVNNVEKKLSGKVNDQEFQKINGVIINNNDSIVMENQNYNVSDNYQFHNKAKTNIIHDKNISNRISMNVNVYNNTNENKSNANINLKKHIININDAKSIEVNSLNAMLISNNDIKKNNNNDNKIRRQNKLIKRIVNNKLTMNNRSSQCTKKTITKVTNRINCNSTNKNLNYDTKHIFNKNTKSLNNFDTTNMNLENNFNIIQNTQSINPKNTSISNNNMIIPNIANTINNNKNYTKKDLSKVNLIRNNAETRKTQYRLGKLYSPNSPFSLRYFKNTNTLNNNIKSNPFLHSYNRTGTLPEEDDNNNCYQFNNNQNITTNNNSNNRYNNNKGYTFCEDVNSINNNKNPMMNIKNTFINFNMYKPNLYLNKNTHYLLSPKNSNNYNNKKIRNPNIISTTSHKKICTNPKNVNAHIVSKSGNIFNVKNNSNIINGNENFMQPTIEYSRKCQVSNADNKIIIDDIFDNKKLFFYTSTECNDNNNNNNNSNNNNVSEIHRRVNSNDKSLSNNNNNNSCVKKFKTVRKKMPYVQINLNGKVYKYRSKSNERKQVYYINGYNTSINENKNSNNNYLLYNCGQPIYESNNSRKVFSCDICSRKNNNNEVYGVGRGEITDLGKVINE